MRICYKCGAQLPDRERVPFKELCPKCEAFLHCCKNCRLYSVDAHNHCRSHTTDYVPDVERGNFCDEFDFRVTPRPEGAADAKPGKSDDGPPRPRGLSPREKFNRLFKD